MSFATEYVHALEGRIRIKVIAVKGSPLRAAELDAWLDVVPGIERVKTNPVTGNVLIHYTPEIIGRGDILHRIRQGGWFDATERARQPESLGVAGAVGERLAEAAVSAAFKLVLKALLRGLL